MQCANGSTSTSLFIELRTLFVRFDILLFQQKRNGDAQRGDLQPQLGNLGFLFLDEFKRIPPKWLLDSRLQGFHPSPGGAVHRHSWYRRGASFLPPPPTAGSAPPGGHLPPLIR